MLSTGLQKAGPLQRLLIVCTPGHVTATPMKSCTLKTDNKQALCCGQSAILPQGQPIRMRAYTASAVGAIAGLTRRLFAWTGTAYSKRRTLNPLQPWVVGALNTVVMVSVCRCIVCAWWSPTAACWLTSQSEKDELGCPAASTARRLHKATTSILFDDMTHHNRISEQLVGTASFKKADKTPQYRQRMIKLPLIACRQ